MQTGDGTREREETAVNDPELKKVGIWVGAGLVGVAILNSVYQAGVAAGVGRSGGYVDHDGGLFPFPLLLIGGLVYFFWWRRRGGGHGGPNGRGFRPGVGAPPRFFEEWHRRAHEAMPPSAAAPRPPATPTYPAAPTAPTPAAGTGSAPQPSAGGSGTTGPTTL